MKNKRLMWGSTILILIIVIGIIMVNQWRTTTYGSVLKSIIPEDAQIKEVEILRMDLEREEGEAVEHKEVTIENNDEIMELTDKISDMKVKKTQHHNTTKYYVMFITANKQYFTIQVDIDQNLKVDGKYNYRIVDDNELIDVIESFEGRWESVEK